ncbi:MAG: hypothetical protein AAF789_06000, partial [Bacteroidota bacterium]
MTKKWIVLTLVSVYFHASYAQVPEIIPPSPNAATYLQYGNLPVKHSTGIPEIKIPIFTLKVDGLAIPISVDYHASGVGVDEFSGPVGLKWTLNAGGAIFRTLVDKPDEEGWLDPHRKGRIDGSWFNSNPASLISSHDNLRFHQATYDHYPDQYSYLIPGYSGQFLFNNLGEPQKEYADPLRIEKVLNGTQLSFTINDPLGNSYFFGSVKEQNSEDLLVASKYSIDGSDHGTFSSSRSAEITGWMLDQILTRNGKLVQFTYEPYQFDLEIPQVSQKLIKAPYCANLSIKNPSSDPIINAEIQEQIAREVIEKCGCEEEGD